MSDMLPDRFTLTMRVDASLQIRTGGELSNWIKPGSEASVSWAGLPSDDEIQVAAEWLQVKILNPTIEDFILTSTGKIQELNAGV